MLQVLPNRYFIHLSSYSKPPHYEVANAVGAAIASISGDVDTILIPSTPNPTSDEIDGLVESVKQQAVEGAIERGAKGGEEKVRIVRVDVVPLAYVANGAMRIVAKAVGELGLEQGRDGDRDGDQDGGDLGVEEQEWTAGVFDEATVRDENVQDENHATGDVDYENYRPKVVNNEWILSKTDLCMYHLLSSVSRSDLSCLRKCFLWKAVACSER